MWNSLNNTIRNVDTLSKFKSELKKIDEIVNHAVPKHYFYGPRKLNIILTQLRRSASLLNYDLFRVIIKNIFKYNTILFTSSIYIATCQKFDI
jgi:hypothetical protein